MTRETDSQDPQHLELGHVYDRLKKLEEGQSDVQKTLHAVQLKLAEGPRFPAWLPVVMVSILLFLAGQSVLALIWGGGVSSEVAMMPELRERLTSAFNGMRSAELDKATLREEMSQVRGIVAALDARCCMEMPAVIERLKNLDEKVVGRTDKGWHRADHDLYAQTVQVQIDALSKRLEVQEVRSTQRDQWWQRLWESGAVKDHKQGK